MLIINRYIDYDLKDIKVNKLNELSSFDNIEYLKVIKSYIYYKLSFILFNEQNKDQDFSEKIMDNLNLSINYYKNATNLSLLAIINYIKGDLNSSRMNFIELLVLINNEDNKDFISIQKSININKLVLNKNTIYYYLANIQYELKDYNNALENYYKYLSIYKDDEKQFEIYSKNVIFFDNLNYKQQSIDFIEKALKNDLIKTNKLSYYLKLGKLYKSIENYEKSSYYFKIC
ncbi:MAG: hypothetical protein U0354_05535 [Candidatus Sericytochromatia bacterium]